MADDFPPEIGKYKILGIVAKGGMGVVYKAIHPSLKRYVVIKKFTVKGRGAATNAERFKREAQILLDLQSPYIVHLFDYFTEGSYRYMVEELVDGLACDKLIKKQIILPVPMAMLLMQDACFGLKYAHSKKVIHRDIKPGNILISKRGEIKITDFGIASDESEREDNLTAEGVALGTPAYMPPEQFEDSSKVDNRADIYALGITLYEMLTGTKPYPGEFTQENIARIKKGKFKKPRKINSDIPKDIERLICRMIRSNAKHRIKNIDVVLKIVRKYLSHYDTHELRVQLARTVALPDKPYKYTDKAFEPKDKVQRVIKKVVLGTACAAVLFMGLLHTGVIHRTVLKTIYSPVNINLELPRSVFLGDLDLPARVSFYVNDGDQIPEVKRTDREFIEEQRTFKAKVESLYVKKFKRADNGYRLYKMKTVFLKKGDYRMKIVVGPYVNWQSFTVTGEDVNMDVRFITKTQTRPMKVHCKANDAETGKDLSAGSVFEVMYGGKWTNITEVPEGEMKSGTVWKIKVSHDGYKEEIFSLLIDWYQDELFLTAALRK